ncbi:hypothetical protein ACFXQA_15120 [Microbacterium sp. P07]|uniref:hypothetical protein n=1 Tax=Microbacterium sp. P07 TaxID=3366952 RepID=UPI003744EE7E
MRISGRRKAPTFIATALLAAVLVLPATAAIAGPTQDEESMTLVVEIPARTPAPTPSASPTTDAPPTPTPTPTATSGPDNDASGELPPTGGEAMLWLLLAGGSVVAVGLMVRSVARDRQSNTAPRS